MQRCAVLALALTDAHMRQTTQQRYCICGDDRGDLPFGTPLIYPLLPNGLEPQMLDFLVVLSVRGDSSAELSLSLQVSLEMHTDGGLISCHMFTYSLRVLCLLIGVIYGSGSFEAPLVYGASAVDLL